MSGSASRHRRHRDEDRRSDRSHHEHHDDGKRARSGESRHLRRKDSSRRSDGHRHPHRGSHTRATGSEDRGIESSGSRYHHRRHSHTRSRRHDEEEEEEAACAGDAARHISTASSASVSEPISVDDFYSKSREFRAWLATSGKKPFGEMSGDESRKLFGTFCTLWNTGGLPPEYYTGRVDDDLAESGRTSFKWSFAANLGESDRMAMLSTRDTVHIETDKAEALVSDIEAGKVALERKKKRREHWEKREAERKVQEMAEYEAAVASTAKRTSETSASALASNTEAVRLAVAAAAKTANPTPAQLMAQLGLKPGQTVVMQPQPGTRG